MIPLFVAVGGVLGALARFAIGGWVSARAGPGFPWGTFAINLAGCLLLGFLVRTLSLWTVSPEIRALLIVGFCGSFTTFSTFGYETVVLLETGEYGAAAVYAGGSLMLGVAGVVAGIRLGSFLG